MIDSQLLLNTVLIVLALTLTVAVIYLVIVLKEFRETVRKTNMVLDDLQRVTNVVSNPVAALTGVLGAVTAGFKAFKHVKSSSEEE